MQRNRILTFSRKQQIFGFVTLIVEMYWHSTRHVQNRICGVSVEFSFCALSSHLITHDWQTIEISIIQPDRLLRQLVPKEQPGWEGECPHATQNKKGDEEKPDRFHSGNGSDCHFSSIVATKQAYQALLQAFNTKSAKDTMAVPPFPFEIFTGGTYAKSPIMWTFTTPLCFVWDGRPRMCLRRFRFFSCHRGQSILPKLLLSTHFTMKIQAVQVCPIVECECTCARHNQNVNYKGVLYCVFAALGYYDRRPLDRHSMRFAEEFL